MKRYLRLCLFLLAGTFSLLFLSACSVQQHLLRNAGDVLSKETSAADDDLDLLMHASAYHLKISETLLEEIPDHVKLAESVTRGFTQYAFVFLMDEADRVESDSIQKATHLRTRAAKMLMRAKNRGWKALQSMYPSLEVQLQREPTGKAQKLASEHVGLAYWVMTSWAGAISLSKDSPDLVADLPQVIRLAELAWQSEPQFDKGALASMMGTLELAKPNAKPEVAEKYFDLSIQWRSDQIAPMVAKAENWAIATRNKEAFILLLQQAIEVSARQTDLTNTVMRRRAKWLLDNVDNYF
jgi:hypothetical protein